MSKCTSTYIHTHIYGRQRREQEHRQDLDVGVSAAEVPGCIVHCNGTLEGGGGGLGACPLGIVCNLSANSREKILCLTIV